MEQAPMIPKIIHYCWFGRKEKPAIVQKCMDSWKVHLRDYEIIEWNEDNFDIKSIPFVQQAYESGKYAFVSDYVRVHALYHRGGIYLDTDVEVFRTFNSFLHHESFWGFEQGNYIATSTIGAKKENALIRIFLESYLNKQFLKEDGSFDSLTNVAIVTRILEEIGLKRNGEKQRITGLGTFYPQTYFSPYDYINCRKFMTEETVAMHHFHKSWLPVDARIKGHAKQLLASVIGGNNLARIRKLVSGV